jgi:hypothetical protein
VARAGTAATAILGALLLGWPAAAADRDGDGDGLSDFAEQHKYRTDPTKADSDGDGRADGEWNERREFTYSVRARVRVMKPAAALRDDFQDARVLAETKTYLELEVIHYPLSSALSALRGDPAWQRRQRDAELARWLRPGLTSNADAELGRELRVALHKAGVVTAKLDDKTFVERVSAWLLKHAPVQRGFTTFYAAYQDGKPYVLPALAKVLEQETRGSGAAAQWERELFAKSMFRNKARGTCTSTAIYLTGCLRALAIPTRIALTIPLVDASSPREVRLLERLRHPKVRGATQSAARTLGRSWASHTLNEVYVGGRWWRLNYSRLGQPSLDPTYGGLATNVLRLHDWSDARIARTVGLRQALGQRSDAFGGSNPYSTTALSDRFGAHSR